MFSIDTSSARELLEAMVTAVSVLGGAMAYCSGYSASQAMYEDQTSEILGQQVNEGLGEGFRMGWPVAIVALIIGTWT